MNKTEKDLRKTVDKLRKEEKEVHSRLREAEQRLAEFMCPFEVGDTIAGGTARTEYIIDRIRYGGYGIYDYSLIGRKIKKDGTPYKNSGEIWHFDFKKVK